jgi:hypothetical protein
MSRQGQLGLAKAAFQRVVQVNMETRPGQGLKGRKTDKKTAGMSGRSFKSIRGPQ